MEKSKRTGPVYNVKAIIKKAASEDQRAWARRFEDEHTLSRVADYTLREVTL